jgi:hypothetical protein
MYHVVSGTKRSWKINDHAAMNLIYYQACQYEI